MSNDWLQDAILACLRRYAATFGPLGGCSPHATMERSDNVPSDVTPDDLRSDAWEKTVAAFVRTGFGLQKPVTVKWTARHKDTGAMVIVTWTFSERYALQHFLDAHDRPEGA